jgi:hypothetical protein
MAEFRKVNDKNISSKPTRREIWRQFSNDDLVRLAHRITDHEMAMLERTALLGECHSVQDLLFMLTVIRQGDAREVDR